MWVKIPKAGGKVSHWEQANFKINHLKNLIFPSSSLSETHCPNHYRKISNLFAKNKPLCVIYPCITIIFLIRWYALNNPLSDKEFIFLYIINIPRGKLKLL